MLGDSVLQTLLGFATIVFGLSLLVQVFQEVYKYLSSSKSRSYVMTLVDFLGPRAGDLLKPGAMTNLQMRGPFQFLRRRPAGHLQPMKKEELALALERTAAPWVRRTLDVLRLEERLQAGSGHGPASSTPSPAFVDLRRQLSGVAEGSPGYATARDVLDYLDEWTGSGEQVHAAGLAMAVRQRFLPLAGQVEAHFDHFMSTFEQVYRRRNLRQTFVIGFGIALLFQMPTDRLYRTASQASLEDSIAAANALIKVSEVEAQRIGQPLRSLEELQPTMESIRKGLSGAGVNLGEFPSVAGLREEFGSAAQGGLYLFWCLVTALLVSFGAPFWNDLTGALLKLNRTPASGPVHNDAQERG